MKLVFATNNRHKLEEISAIIGDKIEILGLNDIGCHDDIPETADTFEGNALLKARYVKDKYGYDCFADDTGLQVEALNGEPGVYSARYAGEPSDSEKNIDKLLEKKKQKKHFRGSGSDSRCGRCLWPFWSISGKSVSDSSDRGYTGAAV